MRAHVGDDIGALCCEYNKKLCSTFMEKLQEITREKSAVEEPVLVALLQGYTYILDVHVACKDQDVGAMSSLKVMCALCLRLVHVGKLGASESIVQSALKESVHFTRKLCVLANSLESADQELTREFLPQVWDSFVDVLRQSSMDHMTDKETVANQRREPNYADQLEPCFGLSLELQEILMQALGVVVSVLDAETFQRILQGLLDDMVGIATVIW